MGLHQPEAQVGIEPLALEIHVQKTGGYPMNNYEHLLSEGVKKGVIVNPEYIECLDCGWTKVYPEWLTGINDQRKVQDALDHTCPNLPEEAKQ